LYAVLAGSEGEHYLVTEFVEGEIYDYVKVVGLTEDARTKICSKIAEQYRLLRSLPGEGYYGRVHNQSWRHNLKLMRTRTVKTQGP
jgi:poly-beta-hydroxyalkanoate depolymerase